MTIFKKRKLAGIMLFLAITSVYAQYTETMDPDGLTKNLKDDYGLVDDNAATDQGAKLQLAINDLNTEGGGNLIIPKGAYTFSSVYLKSNVHLLIDSGTVIKPVLSGGTIFLLTTEKAVENADKQAYIQNVSIRGVGGHFIVDYHFRKRGEKQRAVIGKMVKNFLISDMDVKDNYSTHCGITLTATDVDYDISDWEVSRATDGTIKNIRHFRASPGYGLVQCHGAQSVYFENLYSLGGVALRLESGANILHVGLYDLTAKNITCVNGRSALMMGPHSAKNGVVTVDGLLSISCTYAATMGSGGVKEDAPDQTPGYFSDSSSVKNIHAVFGTTAQFKGTSFEALPTSDYYELMKIYSDNKFFDGPSIGGVKYNPGNYSVDIQNVTLEGFEYYNDKPILTEADNRPVKWGTEKTNWINTHQGDQWKTVKGVVIKDYDIEDYLSQTAPVLSPDTVRTSTPEDESLIIPLGGVINDPDVDPLPLVALSGPGNGSIVIVSNDITYTPDLNFFGTDTIVYEVCDYETPSKCSQGSIIINISNVNDKPLVKSSVFEYDVKSDTSSYTIAVSDSLVSDPDGDALTITIDSDPDNGTASVDQTGNITYIPNPGFEGNDTIVFSACDTSEPKLCVSSSIILSVESNEIVSLDMNSADKHSFTVYPNPAGDQIHIKGEVLFNKEVNLSMFDMLGREVYRKQNILSAGNSIYLDISHLPKACYSLRILSDKQELIGVSKVLIR